MAQVTFESWLAASAPQRFQRRAWPLSCASRKKAPPCPSSPAIAKSDRGPRRGRDPRRYRRQGNLGQHSQAPDLHRRGDHPAGKADRRAARQAARDLRPGRAGRPVPALQAESARPRPSSRARPAWNHWPTGCGIAATAWHACQWRIAGQPRQRLHRRGEEDPRHRRGLGRRGRNHHRAPVGKRRPAQHHTHRYMHDGFAKTAKGEKAKSPSKFENYFTFEERVQELLKPENSHRYLAMRRGWMEEELTLHLGGPTPPEPADRPTAKPRVPVDPWPKSCCTCSRPRPARCPISRARLC
jgi:hypothetical protein